MILHNNQHDSQVLHDVDGFDGIKRENLWQEFMWLGMILIIGLFSRLLFIRSFPTTPISDFLSLLDFAILFRNDWLAKNAWQWHYFSPGLSLILSFLMEFIPKSPETIGRWATAISTGLVPLIPYLLWKDVFHLRTRVFASLLLAVWPGQILFSSVVAQDNWIIFPTLTVVVLAVRNLVVKNQHGFPISAALFYAATVAIRQEMLIVLMPATIIAIMSIGAKNRVRNLLIGALIVSIVFIALILQRGEATGRYTLKTEHLGWSLLGAYIPGAGMGWIDPHQYMEAARPELMKNGDLSHKLDREALSLSWHEFSNRPAFHLIRIFGSTLTNIFEMDTQIIWWSLGSEGVLPYQYHEDAVALMKTFFPILKYYPVIANILFASSLFFALSQHYLLKSITPILATIAIKVGIHAVIVSQPRYFLIVVALEMLVIAIVWDKMLTKGKENWSLTLRSILLGIITIFLLMICMNSARVYVAKHDTVLQPSYNSLCCEGTVAGHYDIDYHEECLVTVKIDFVKYGLW